MSSTVTLSEIEATVRKAARAVGLDWGICEEAGKSARWLAAFGLPGPDLMLKHLLYIESRDYKTMIPDCKQSPWRSPSESVCPIIAGAAISDRSAYMVADKEYMLVDVCYPLLMVAALGQAAQFYKTPFSARWLNVTVNCFENGIHIEGSREEQFSEFVASVSCRHGGYSVSQIPPSVLSYSIDEPVWEEILNLAFRTCVPASEESRAGAGAGMLDND